MEGFFYRCRPRIVGLSTDSDLGWWSFPTDLGWLDFLLQIYTQDSGVSDRCKPRMVLFPTDVDLGWWGFLQMWT